MIAPGDELCGACGSRMDMFEPPNPPADERVWLGQCGACGRIEGKGAEAMKTFAKIFPNLPAGATVSFPQNVKP